ncbi:unnamed protein product [Adineta ricciae]|uniref:Uncharacterized protein n=1 Tax=Adineta ricciae TaxID=249248 RepID=A0A815QYV4_ADIRI|nr:unnamed protein product [Adineta ricciae]CAF1654541.1 unnamed protein product [Adineta ricciae]
MLLLPDWLPFGFNEILSLFSFGFGSRGSAVGIVRPPSQGIRSISMAAFFGEWVDTGVWHSSGWCSSVVSSPVVSRCKGQETQTVVIDFAMTKFAYPFLPIPMWALKSPAKMVTSVCGIESNGC